MQTGNKTFLCIFLMMIALNFWACQEGDEPPSETPEGYEIYRNDEEGYQLTYPEDWELLEEEGHSYSSFFIVQGEEGISVSGHYAENSLEEEAQRTLNYLQENIGFTLELTTEEEMIINGNEGLLQTYVDPQGTGVIQYLFAKDEELDQFYILLFVATPETFELHEEEVQEFMISLESFKPVE